MKKIAKVTNEANTAVVLTTIKGYIATTPKPYRFNKTDEHDDPPKNKGVNITLELDQDSDLIDVTPYAEVSVFSRGLRFYVMGLETRDNKTVEVESYFKKGDRLVATGEYSPADWSDKTTGKHGVNHRLRVWRRAYLKWTPQSEMVDDEPDTMRS